MRSSKAPKYGQVEVLPFARAVFIYRYDRSTFTLIISFFPDVYDYMVTRLDIDGKPVENYRGFAEATNLLDSGHVDAIMCVKSGEKCQLKACIRSSQTTSRAYDVGACFEGGDLRDVSCSCTAGLGETCSHVGALLLKVVEATRKGMTGSACTDEKCLWNASTKQNVTPEPVESVYGHKNKILKMSKFASHLDLQQHFCAAPLNMEKLKGTLLFDVINSPDVPKHRTQGASGT